MTVYNGGPTLAMVSWNLKSGSRVSGDSAENWASDRKPVIWGEREKKKQFSHMTPHGMVLISVSYLFKSNHYLIKRRFFVGPQWLQSPSQNETKANLFSLQFSYLLYFSLFYSILGAEWPVKLLTGNNSNCSQGHRAARTFCSPVKYTHIQYTLLMHTHTQSPECWHKVTQPCVHTPKDYLVVTSAYFVISQNKAPQCDFKVAPLSL